MPGRLRPRAGPGTELEQARDLCPPGGAAHGLTSGASAHTSRARPPQAGPGGLAGPFELRLGRARREPEAARQRAAIAPTRRRRRRPGGAHAQPWSLASALRDARAPSQCKLPATGSGSHGGRRALSIHGTMQAASIAENPRSGSCGAAAKSVLVQSRRGTQRCKSCAETALQIIAIDPQGFRLRCAHAKVSGRSSRVRWGALAGPRPLQSRAPLPPPQCAYRPRFDGAGASPRCATSCL